MGSVVLHAHETAHCTIIEHTELLTANAGGTRAAQIDKAKIEILRKPMF